MDQLRSAVDVLKVELVTEEIARINKEAAAKAEVAREIDDFVRALNQQHPSGRLGQFLKARPHAPRTAPLSNRRPSI